MSDTERKAPAVKTEHAVALRYRGAGEAPQVLAGGSAELARKIVELAQQNGVPVTADTKLSELLSQLDLGDQIEPQTYQLVAEVISFLYHCDQEYKG